MPIRLVHDGWVSQVLLRGVGNAQINDLGNLSDAEVFELLIYTTATRRSDSCFSMTR